MEKYFIHLLKCVLEGKTPDSKPPEITYDQLYQFAKFHGVESMIFYAIERMEQQPDAAFHKIWKNRRDQNLMMSFVQLSERDIITKALTKRGIHVLLLKGCRQKEMYPQIDYRQMADLDILIEKDKAEHAKNIMEALGYVTEHYNMSNHDSYMKEPYVCVELHRDMMPDVYGTASYFHNIWEKTVADHAAPNLYHLNWNDYYIFLIAHFAKHYFSSGSGIRSIMDIHIFLEQHGSDLDQTYLACELGKLKLWQFKQTAETLAGVWFSGSKADSDSLEMAEYVLRCGVYGIRKNKIQNDITNLDNNSKTLFAAKTYYILKRIFMKPQLMKSQYKCLKKYPFLIPVCWVHRMIYSVLFKGKVVKYELNAVKEMMKEIRISKSERHC